MRDNHKPRRPSAISLFGAVVVCVGIFAFFPNIQLGLTIIGFGLTYIFIGTVLSNR